MALHITLLTPSDHTPAYLLTCSRSLHRTVIDPISVTDVTEALGKQPLDLILLTTTTPSTLAAARALHLHTGAPVLTSITSGTAAAGAHLPVARKLMDGEVVGLGPLAQTLALPAPMPEPLPEHKSSGHTTQPLQPIGDDIMAYAIGSAGVIFVGGLFTPHSNPRPEADKLPGQKTPKREYPATLRGLPPSWQVFGGHAPQATEATAPTLSSLL